MSLNDLYKEYFTKRMEYSELCGSSDYSCINDDVNVYVKKLLTCFDDGFEMHMIKALENDIETLNELLSKNKHYETLLDELGNIGCISPGG